MDIYVKYAEDYFKYHVMNKVQKISSIEYVICNLRNLRIDSHNMGLIQTNMKCANQCDVDLP
jgi:hypothetical protein